jgi:hypothetical protein
MFLNRGSLGIVLKFSPYLNVFEATRAFRKLIEDVRFDEISISATSPRLLISAVDVRTGEFRILRSHAIDKEPADEITSRCDPGFGGGAPALSSRLSERARVLGWPVAQNPPVRDLPNAAPARARVDFHPTSSG